MCVCVYVFVVQMCRHMLVLYTYVRMLVVFGTCVRTCGVCCFSHCDHRGFQKCHEDSHQGVEPGGEEEGECPLHSEEEAEQWAGPEEGEHPSLRVQGQFLLYDRVVTVFC